MRFRPLSQLSAEELMLLNCVVCWRRLLRAPWTARSNQSILKKINPDYSLEGLILKLKLSNTLATWCEELTHWKRPWCWERLKAGGEGGNRGWDGWMASLTQWIRVWENSGRWWTGKPGMLKSKGLQKVGHDWRTTNTPLKVIIKLLSILLVLCITAYGLVTL